MIGNKKLVTLTLNTFLVLHNPITYICSSSLLYFNSEVSVQPGIKKEPCVNHGLSRNCK